MKTSIKKIKVVTLCSGYGAQEMAFDSLSRDYPEFDWELLAWSEIEPNAIKAHKICHPEYADRNLGDMTKADYTMIKEAVDVLFYSTPCQSVSVAGQNKGMKEGTDAASALIWHTRRAIEMLKPKVSILENVKGMIMGKNLKEFHKWQSVMEAYGYTNFVKVLNSKDYGVPQNRERIFMVSIRDCDRTYHFPKPFKLEKRIKDILEPYGTVDENFYFKPEQLLRIIAHCDRKVEERCGFKTQFLTEDEISGCIGSQYGCRETDPCIKERTDKIIKLGNYTPRGTHAGTLVSVDGIAPTVMGQHGTVTGIVEPILIQRLSIYGGNAQVGTVAVAMRGRNPQNPSDRTKGAPTEQRLEFGDNIANCITTVQKDSMVAEPQPLSFDNLPDKTVVRDEDGKGYLWQDGMLWRIRKLVPIECGRLMGVSDSDVKKMIDAGISKSALYGLFGNSIVVDVLYYLFYKLFINLENEDAQLSLFDF